MEHLLDCSDINRRLRRQQIREEMHRSILVLAYAAACIGFGIIMGRMAAFYF